MWPISKQCSLLKRNGCYKISWNWKHTLFHMQSSLEPTPVTTFFGGTSYLHHWKATRDRWFTCEIKPPVWQVLHYFICLLLLISDFVFRDFTWMYRLQMSKGQWWYTVIFVRLGNINPWSYYQRLRPYLRHAYYRARSGELDRSLWSSVLSSTPLHCCCCLTQTLRVQMGPSALIFVNLTFLSLFTSSIWLILCTSLISSGIVTWNSPSLKCALKEYFKTEDTIYP